MRSPLPSATTIRLEVEASLAHKIPSALTPAAKKIRPLAATGLTCSMRCWRGLPIGAVTELIVPGCSGRTSIAASFSRSHHPQARFVAWIPSMEELASLIEPQGKQRVLTCVRLLGCIPSQALAS
jgi:hypothetical protein